MVFLKNLYFLASVLSLVSLVSSIPVKQANGPPSIIKIPLYTKSSSHFSQRSFNTTLRGPVAYFADIQVGTPPKTFSVLVDTGSSYFWLQGEECPASDCKFNRYFHSNSSSAIKTDLILEIEYLDRSSAQGNYYYDTVTFAGATLTHQLVGSSNANGSLYHFDKSIRPEGLIGLSYPSLIERTNHTYDEYYPFVFELMFKKIIPEPIFALSLSDFEPGSLGAELVLGGVNPEKYTGTIEYVPVVPNKKYNRYTDWRSLAQDLRVIRNDGILIKNDAAFENSLTINAIMDSGTTFTYINTEFLNQLYISITGSSPNKTIEYMEAEFFEIDCIHYDSNDHIQLSLSHLSNNQTIDTEPLKLQVPISSFVEIYSSEQCVFTIFDSKPLNISTDYILFGQNFLRNFYTVSNMLENTLGFAPAVNYNTKVFV